jgi:hypothetical protein
VVLAGRIAEPAHGYVAGMDLTPEHGSHVPGGTHRQADLRDELAGDDLDLTPRRDEIDDPDVTVNDQLLARSDLAIYLLPSAFPATALELLDIAHEQGGPPELLERLQQLPPATYHTVQEVWLALGGPTEAREPRRSRATAAGPPAAGPRAPRPVPPVPAWVDGVARAAGQLTEATVRVLVGGSVLLLTRTARQLRPRRRPKA